jgi:hypothetical protein
VEESLDMGWKLLALLPRNSLKRVKAAEIEKWMQPEASPETKEADIVSEAEVVAGAPEQKK